MSARNLPTRVRHPAPADPPGSTTPNRGKVGSLAAGLPIGILHNIEGDHTFIERGRIMGKGSRQGNIPAGEFARPRPPVSDVPARAGPRGRAGFLLILAAAIGIQLIDIKRPFVDRHDWATAHQSAFARNHLRYGLRTTQTRCMYSKFAERHPDARRIYPDHPPLLSLALALSMTVFGVSEITVRSVAGAFTVATIGLTMSLARGLFGRSISLLAGLALLPMPILVYFGHIPCHETVALPFALLALRGYFGWLLPEQFQRRPRRDAALFVVGTVLMILTSWVGMIFAGVTWAHFAFQVVVRDRKSSPGAWGLVTLPAATAAAITLAHILWSMDWNLEHLYGLFAFRSGIKRAEIPFTAASWFSRQVEWIWRGYTAAGAALAGLGLLLVIRTRSSRSPDPIRNVLTYAGPLLVPGLLWIVVFRGGSFIHEYWWLHVTPFVAMLIAVALSILGRTMSRFGRAGAALTVAVLLVAMGAETAQHYRYFRHRPTVFAAAYRPCQYINARTPQDAVVSGNRRLWVRYDYYEGPQSFLAPQIAWYLDRFYLRATTIWDVALVADQAQYYLFIPSKDDTALGDYLRDRFKLEAEWPDACVFDLTVRRDQLRLPHRRYPGRTPIHPAAPPD